MTKPAGCNVLPVFLRPQKAASGFVAALMKPVFIRRAVCPLPFPFSPIFQIHEVLSRHRLSCGGLLACVFFPSHSAPSLREGVSIKEVLFYGSVLNNRSDFRNQKGQNDHSRGRRGQGERRRPHHSRRIRNPRDHQLYGPPRLRPHLPFPCARYLRQTEAAHDGQPQHLTVWHELHCLH